MDTAAQIKKQQQKIARLEKARALESVKKRRADTRRKIEYGGLVIKSGMGTFTKAEILGALSHAEQLINQDSKYLEHFKAIGDKLFLGTNDNE